MTSEAGERSRRLIEGGGQRRAATVRHWMGEHERRVPSVQPMVLQRERPQGRGRRRQGIEATTEVVAEPREGEVHGPEGTTRFRFGLR